MPAQLPFAWQTSLKVRALPSLQVMPRRGAGSKMQPFAPQVSTVHELLSLQPETTHCGGATPAQVPLVWQTSFCVPALPSSQLMPRRGAGSKVQPFAPQVSTVHELLSLQPETTHCGGATPAQVPLVWQTSFCVPALPSSQLMPRRGAGSKVQPFAPQVSTVHELLSLQPETTHCGGARRAGAVGLADVVLRARVAVVAAHAAPRGRVEVQPFVPQVSTVHELLSLQPVTVHCCGWAASMIWFENTDSAPVPS